MYPLIWAVSGCVALKNMVFEPCCSDMEYGLCTLLLNLGVFGVRWCICRTRSQVCYRASDFELGLKWKENCKFCRSKTG